MNLQLLNHGTKSKSQSLCFLLLASVLLFNPGSAAEAGYESINIGAIIDVGSRTGREQKTAMKIAAKNFNGSSTNHKLTIHFKNITTDPMHAVSAAENLIREKHARAIIGMQTWEQAALVAEVGKRAQVPVLSFAGASITPPLLQSRWPFLIQMASNVSEQINCMAAIVQSYHWRKVIAIYEDETFGGDSGMLTLLSVALQHVGAEVEYHVALPPFSSITNPEGVIKGELLKLLRKQSRVFIVLRSSVSMAARLFSIANQIGLMDRDSVWILGDSISSLLDSVDNSFFSSVQGALGIKIHHSEDSRPFSDFKRHFQKMYRSKYPEEANFSPSFHALQAYDSIKVVAENLGSNKSRTQQLLLKKIQSTNFTGFSGNVHFHNGMLSGTSRFQIVNIVGRSYKELGIWSPRFGFSDVRAERSLSAVNGVDSMKKFSSLINWPGELERFPKGWAMPNNAKPLKIGVPGRTSFEKFVKVEWDDESNPNKYHGFCIDLFEMVVNVLEKNYSMPYKFFPVNGTYDDLVEHVINKTFDAVVGDVTILANRSRYVEFTQPFAESGLTMVVRVKNRSQRAWIFLKPFTWNMWIATFGILFYTMFVVWFMEHQSNPEFRGPWKDQLGTAVWFTFSSLFFAHREKINSNYTKMVIAVWLFVVFVLTSSYTASLTSMLTVPRLEPNVTDIEWIRRTNATVGCDGDSFVEDYLRNVLRIQNLKVISNQYDYPGELNSGNITAAFLELPYKKVFLKEYCNDYAQAGPSYRFGGLGFVFQKGSPIAHDVSEAILMLTEDGKLKGLEEEWFGSSGDCPNTNANNNMDSLSFESFWALYLISGTISTISILVFVARLLRRAAEDHHAHLDVSSSDKGVWNKMVKIVTAIGLVGYLANARSRSLSRAPTFASNRHEDEWRSTRWNLVSHSDQTEIELAQES